MSVQSEDLDLSAEASTWPQLPLGEVVDVLDRKRKPITKRDRVAGPYPYYGATGVLDWVDDYLFDEPLVLIGEDGAKWEAGANTAFAIAGKTWVNNHAHVLRPNRERVLDDWLIYYLNAIDLSDFISGMTVPKLNQGRLREIPIPLPSLDEQKRIVAVLDQAFAALDRARALVDANLSDTSSLYAAAVETLFEAQSEGWERGNLCELVGTVHTGPFGSLLHKSDYIEGGIPLINPANIVDGQITPTLSKTISYEAAERLAAYKVRAGDLVIGRRGEMGRCAPVKPEMDGWICGTGCFVIRPNDGVLSDFVGHLLRRSNMVSRLTSIATGTTMHNLNNKALSGMPIEIPKADVQRRILERIAALQLKTRKSTNHYSQRLLHLSQLRQSLLHRAFSGGLI